MHIIKTPQELMAFREPLWPEGKILSFVPTMGALHEGHLSLVRAAQAQSDICLPYIFLNPKQFSENEDLDQYPETLETDLKALEALGIEHIYSPDRQVIYPHNFQTIVKVSEISKPLEGEHRPHFFDGVTTIVCKMLLQCLPDIAMFGEKDYQQFRVIERMVIDLNIPVKVQSAPTVRDENGLALSSRNQYLSKDQYEIAIHLNKILKQFSLNDIDESEAIEQLKNTGFDKVDYCTARNSETFLSEEPNRVFVAAWVGQTRLIDNMALAA
ncbi:MAG: pantoate--beta-alanine ligase [Pseudomonadota bacterium]